MRYVDIRDTRHTRFIDFAADSGVYAMPATLIMMMMRHCCWRHSDVLRIRHDIYFYAVAYA